MKILDLILHGLDLILMHFIPALSLSLKIVQFRIDSFQLGLKFRSWMMLLRTCIAQLALHALLVLLNSGGLIFRLSHIELVTALQILDLLIERCDLTLLLPILLLHKLIHLAILLFSKTDHLFLLLQFSIFESGSECATFDICNGSQSGVMPRQSKVQILTRAARSIGRLVIERCGRRIELMLGGIGIGIRIERNARDSFRRKAGLTFGCAIVASLSKGMHLLLIALYLVSLKQRVGYDYTHLLTHIVGILVIGEELLASLTARR